MGKEKMIEQILKDNNIRMNINACGCCESPWVSFEYQGKLLVKDSEEFIITMIPKLELGDD